MLDYVRVAITPAACENRATVVMLNFEYADGSGCSCQYAGLGRLLEDPPVIRAGVRSVRLVRDRLVVLTAVHSLSAFFCLSGRLRLTTYPLEG